MASCEHHHCKDAPHNHHRGTPQGQLQFAIAFTGIIFLAELVGGLWTNSLALLSDAAHVFMDVFAMVLALVAMRLAALPASDTRTYGWHRAEIFAAMINGLTLLAISLGILYEAWKRFSEPPEIKGLQMMLIALGGLVANAVVVLKLRGHNHRDLNMHSAFLHVVGDMLASAGVVAGGVIIALSGWTVVDAIISAGIGLLILRGAGRLVWDSAHILLEGVPKGIDINKVAGEIRKIEGVRDLHHLHIWSICSNIMALSSHVLIDPRWRGNPETLRKQINQKLSEMFGINDTTLQFDSTPEEHDRLVHDIQHPAETDFEDE